MAYAEVQLTVESLAHLQRIIEKAIDTSQSDLLTPRFRPVVEIIHYVVAGVEAEWDDKERVFRLATPTEAQEAIKKQLDEMVVHCAKSIQQTSSDGPPYPVLTV